MINKQYHSAVLNQRQRKRTLDYWRMLNDKDVKECDKELPLESGTIDEFGHVLESKDVVEFGQSAE